MDSFDTTDENNSHTIDGMTRRRLSEMAEISGDIVKVREDLKLLEDRLDSLGMNDLTAHEVRALRILLAALKRDENPEFAFKKARESLC